jgi:cobalt-zinc-cadmium resistance protein CzcA
MKHNVAERVSFPPGYYATFGGEFENQERAMRRLELIVPVSVLLFFNFGSMVDTLLAMSVIPMAIFGGVLGLLITGTPFSVSAAIGFIALFGIAVMDGIIILSQYNQLIDEGYERIRAVIRTGELQLRPVLMTCVVAGVGLLPAALSEGIGSQVQKPLAVVVVTGMMLAPIVILVTLPVLISVFSRRER